MSVHVPTWREIAPVIGPEEAAAIARDRLLEIGRLQNVGRPSDRDHAVHRVVSIEEALQIFHRYLKREPILPNVNVNGTLNEPHDLLLNFADAHPELYSTPNMAAHNTLDEMQRGQFEDLSDAIAALLSPDLATLDTTIAIGDYVTEYVRFLFLEIYFGDRLRRRSTYFRDQLPWFVAGFFPCGWVGDWPVGRMRVL